MCKEFEWQKLLFSVDFMCVSARLKWSESHISRFLETKLKFKTVCKCRWRGGRAEKIHERGCWPFCSETRART